MPPNEKGVIYTIDSLKSIENEDNDKVCSLEDALQKTGFGKFSIALIVICGAVLMAVLNETMGVMFIMPAAQCDLNLSASDKGILSAVSYLGILLSSHMWGYLADTRGRRKMIIYSTLLSNVFTLISAFMPTFTTFAIFRFLSGFFISGPSATIFTFVGENISSHYRSSILAYTCMFVGFSAVYIPGLASLIIPLDWTLQISDTLNFRPWRALVLLYGLPGFIGAISMFFLRESPKFHMAQGHENKALETLQWVYHMNTGKAPEDFPVKKLKTEVNAAYMKNLERTGPFSIVISMWKQTIPLLKPPLVVNFLTCSTLQFCIFFVSSGMGMWFAEISNRIASTNDGFSGSICDIITTKPQILQPVGGDEVICDDSIKTSTYFDAIMLGVVYCCIFLLLGTVLKYINRNIVLATALFLSGAAGIILQFMTQPLAVISFFAAHLICSGICISMMNATAVELFPTHLRAMAVCVALMFGRMGSIVGTNVIGQFLETNCSTTFWVFTSTMVMCGCLSFILWKKK